MLSFRGVWRLPGLTWSNLRNKIGRLNKKKRKVESYHTSRKFKKLPRCFCGVTLGGLRVCIAVYYCRADAQQNNESYILHTPTLPPVTIANGNNRGEACVVFAREQIEQLLRPLVAFHFQPLLSARSFESSITICSVSQHNIAANYHATCCFAISYTPCFGEKVGHFL